MEWMLDIQLISEEVKQNVYVIYLKNNMSTIKKWGNRKCMKSIHGNLCHQKNIENY